jgi:uncharacterized protein (TIGR03067 family)
MDERFHRVSGGQRPCSGGLKGMLSFQILGLMNPNRSIRISLQGCNLGPYLRLGDEIVSKGYSCYATLYLHPVGGSSRPRFRPLCLGPRQSGLKRGLCKRIRLEFADGKFHSDSNGEKSDGKVTIDPTTTPANMDLLLEEGAEAGKTLKCIYKLENDLLYIAFSVAMDQVRPIDFESNQDNKLLVLEYERTQERLPARAESPKEPANPVR